MNVKQHKTPLRYPGGKSRATKFLDNYFPHLGTMEEYYEPFLGGGSVALYVTKKYPHLKVRVNDLYYPLYEFWINLRDNSEQLHKGVMKFRKKNDTPDKIKKKMDSIRDAVRSDNTDSIERSINFYILNKNQSLLDAKTQTISIIPRALLELMGLMILLITLLYLYKEK